MPKQIRERIQVQYFTFSLKLDFLIYVILIVQRFIILLKRDGI